jgi:hypothetical protein
VSRALLVAALSASVLAAAAVSLRAAGKDMGTGYELENVEVMDPKMRLVDARKYMITFNEALSVACRDCHDLRDFASDEKPLKATARDMMKMQLELNERWFPGKGEVVTCWTCHRGSRFPPSSSGFTSLLADSGLGEPGEPADPAAAEGAKDGR